MDLIRQARPFPRLSTSLAKARMLRKLFVAKSTKPCRTKKISLTTTSSTCHIWIKFFTVWNASALGERNLFWLFLILINRNTSNALPRITLQQNVQRIGRNRLAKGQEVDRRQGHDLLVPSYFVPQRPRIFPEPREIRPRSLFAWKRRFEVVHRAWSLPSIRARPEGLSWKQIRGHSVEDCNRKSY